MPTLALIGVAHIYTPNFIDRLQKRSTAKVILARFFGVVIKQL